MYAIVQVGGRQYRAAAGQRLVVDRLDVEPGSRVHLDDVRMLVAEEGDDTETEIGRPRVADVAVAARAISHFRGPKILVFKYKPKKRYRRHQGFRAELTELRIEEVRRGVYEDKPAPVVASKKRTSAQAAKAAVTEAAATTTKPSAGKADASAGSVKKTAPTRRPTASTAAAVSKEAQPSTKAVAPKAGSARAPSARAASAKTAPSKSASVKTKAEKAVPTAAKPKATTTPKEPAAKAPVGEKKPARTRAQRSDKQEQPDGS